MSPLFISLLMAAGFAVFGVMAWRKLAIVAALAPDNRFDRLGERTVRLLKMGIGQSRLLTGDFRPGLMHAVIFVGFMTLLVRKLHLIVIGYWPEAVIPGAFGAAYTAWKDFVELAVLAAVAFGFWRRFVRRPRRLEPNREAVLVLGLITLIMLTDFGFDAFRFAKLAPVDAGSRARAGVGVDRRPARRRPAGTLARRHRSGLPPVLLGADADRVHLPGDPADRRTLPHRHRAAERVLRARRAAEPRAQRRPRTARRGRRRSRPARRSARRPRSTSPGRKASTPSPAPSAAAARTPARPSSPASRCR